MTARDKLIGEMFMEMLEKMKSMSPRQRKKYIEKLRKELD